MPGFRARHGALLCCTAVIASAATVGLAPSSVAATPAALLVSSDPSRAAGEVLAGTILNGDVYPHLSGSDVSRVRFYLDDPGLEGTARVERIAPFDLMGGTADTAHPLDTSTLRPGRHTLSAKVQADDGSTRVLTSTFTVSRSSAPGVTTPGAGVLRFSRSSTGSHPSLLDGEELTGVVYPSLTDADATQVSFYLDGRKVNVEENAPWDMMGGTTTTARPLDTRTLAEGTHVLSAQVLSSTGTTSTVSSTFTVPGRTSEGPVVVDRPEPAPRPEAPVPVPVQAGSSAERVAVALGFPGSGTTGVPAGTVLRRSGSLTVSTPGAVVDGLDIDGCVRVTAPDVVIRRSRIRCSGDYGINNLQAEDLLVEDTEIDGRGRTAIAVCCGSWTMRRVNIHSTIEGPRLSSQQRLEDSFIHDLVRVHGSHNDVLQSTGGSDVVVRHNTLLAYSASAKDPMNAAVMLGSETKPSLTDYLLQDNFMNGGNFTVNVRDDTVARNVVFRDNLFWYDHRYGIRSSLPHGISWDNNTYAPRP